MSTPAPDAVKRLVDHFDQNRKVFLSPDTTYKRLPKAKISHEQESPTCTTAATHKQIAIRP